jgi:hypothetical protein
MRTIKNKTYRNFLIVKNRIVKEKHYDETEASKLTHLVFDNYEQDKGYGNNSIEFFLDRILPKEEYEAEYDNEPNTLIVCKHCLMAIESRQGYQPIIKTYDYWFDAEEIEWKCDWCEETDIAELYEI